jgi:hypothetical protein
MVAAGREEVSDATAVAVINGDDSSRAQAAKAV